ncbi:MAG: YgfZ/GcvT domain-containing protein [Kiloniellales bacterium]
MIEKAHVVLAHRSLLALEGPEVRSFLQGLISNDVHKVAPDRAIYAALLTPQGKFLHDLFIVECDGALMLDCEAERRHDLIRRLKLYRLRAKVEIADRSDDYLVAALIGEAALAALELPAEPGTARAIPEGVVYTDPRLAAAGARAVLRRETGVDKLLGAGFAAAEMAAYDRLRLGLGLPDGSRDMVVEKATLLDSGFDELNGVDWDKGCYVGQELTARTKYRGLTKKRLVPVEIEGPVPEPGTPVILGGRQAGEMRSARDGVGLALMRLEAVKQGGGFTAGGARLRPRKPDWTAF